jgi:glycosyltransferase involved in cell wall biosynthesis
MPGPVLTVAMPFYNSGATLELAIRSLLHQTFRDFEILLCDDGSTDQSLAIARSFADPRIVCWSDGHRRRLAARLNECIDRAAGRFLARMDADDIAYPERFASQLHLLHSQPAVDLCAGAAMVFGQRGRALWCFAPPQDHAAIIHSPFRGFPLWHPLWMGRIEWFRRWRYQESAWLAQDQELLLRSYRESVFANLPQILLGYRRERTSLRKLWRYKLLHMHYVRQQLGTKPDPWQSLQLLAVISIRFAANCAASLSGPHQRLGHQSTRAPSATEIAEWNSLWIWLASWYWPPSSESFNPASLLPRAPGREGGAR